MKYIFLVFPTIFLISCHSITGRYNYHIDIETQIQFDEFGILLYNEFKQIDSAFIVKNTISPYKEEVYSYTTSNWEKYPYLSLLKLSDTIYKIKILNCENIESSYEFNDRFYPQELHSKVINILKKYSQKIKIINNRKFYESRSLPLFQI